MADDINVNEPAFPRDHRNDGHNGLTARQYAAIKLRVPNSGTGWLDDMILQSLWQEFAKEAMEGMLAASENYRTTELCRYACGVADAMLIELEEQWLTTSVNC